METQAAEETLLLLPSLHLPTHPHHPLHLDSSPLQILSLNNPSSSPIPRDSFTPALGLATVLYNWHPHALLAFLDTESWVSFTWLVSIGGKKKKKGEDGEEEGEEKREVEIGRVRGSVTVGELDGKGEWRWCVAFEMTTAGKRGGGEDLGGRSEEEANGEEQGKTTSSLLGGPWRINVKESIVPGISSSSSDAAAAIDTHARSSIYSWLHTQIWETAPGTRHDLYVESLALGVDAWSDGMKISPHWLYSAMDLGRCTACGRPEGGIPKGDGTSEVKLRKCAKCGTAAYCGRECQTRDWKVHKGVCVGMSLEERGKAVFYSRGEGGLAGLKPEEGRGVGEEEGVEEDGEEEEDDDDDDEGGWVYESGSRSIEELRRMPAKLSESETRETVDVMERMMREASTRR